MVGSGQEFIERTKYHNLAKSDQMKGVHPPPLELPYDSTQPRIEVPKPEAIQINDISLRKAVENRSSVRAYSTDALSLEEVSYLLWCTQGVKETFPPDGTMRIVPSAGARHALETYLLINHVKGVNPGLYRFLAVDHHLVEVNKEPDIGDKIMRGCLGQQFVTLSGITFIWTAVPYRMTWRYAERGYRYLYLDAGHACQNLYLCAESIGCGVCAIGAFLDDEMNCCLDLDGRNQFVIYIATVGKYF